MNSMVKELHCKISYKWQLQMVGPAPEEDIEADAICVVIEENGELKRQVQSLESQIEDQTQVIHEVEELRARNLALLSQIAQLTQQRQTRPSQDDPAHTSSNAQEVDSDNDKEDDQD